MKFLCLAIMLMSATVARAGVDLNVMPTSPIVITADYTYRDAAGNQVTVEAPWFAFRVHIFNQMVDPLMIVGMRVTVSGTDLDGSPVEQVTDIHPNDYNTDKCFYNHFGKFEANGNPGGPVFNDKNLFLTPTSNSAVDCQNGELTFFIGNNPVIKKNGDLIQYNVRVQPLGWFEAGGAPKGRFDGFVTLATQ